MREPSPDRRSRRRLVAIVGCACVALLGVLGFDVWAGGGGDRPEGTAPVAEPTASGTARSTPPPLPATPTAPPPPVLSSPGGFPEDGPREFGYAATEGEVLGRSGTLMRFRLAVEVNLAEDPATLAGFVDDTLGDPRGWAAGGQYRFQRVPEGAGHDFTIYLATSGTAARMCAEGGLDVLGSGLPDGGVSCHYDGRVVLNLARWRLSVPHFVDQQVPLEVYRQMVLNHEVGHALGFGHETCPGQGEPAPVMQQQTIRLDGCRAYAWPYRDGQRYAGEPVS